MAGGLFNVAKHARGDDPVSRQRNRATVVVPVLLVRPIGWQPTEALGGEESLNVATLDVLHTEQV